MSNKALTFIAIIVTGIILITGTIWYLRSRDAGVPVYNPFQTSQESAVEEYDPPSDLSSEYDQLVPITVDNNPTLIEPINLPSGLLQ